MRSIENVDVSGKRVLVRVDFNVPLADGTVTDDTRIQAALPTIKLLLDGGARLVLASHLGRPSGIGYEAAYSLAPAARVLSRIIGQEVALAACGGAIEEGGFALAGPDTAAAVAALAPGQALMLENLRFDPREKKNDAGFAAELAALADIYVDDAFGCAHRAHASVAALPSLLPDASYAGLLMAAEVETLSGLLKQPKRPFVAVLGGSKVSDKIQVIDSLLDIADSLLIGGAMCFTFLAAQGHPVGSSLKEDDWIERARDILNAAEDKGKRFLIPVDVVAAERIAADAATLICDATEIPDGQMGLDIGPVTSQLYAREIAEASTVFWNGPMGVFECPPFAAGTNAVAKAVAANEQAVTVIGGGDSVAAIKQSGLADKISFISTGGGASMQLIEGKPLPGVEAIEG